MNLSVRAARRKAALAVLLMSAIVLTVSSAQADFTLTLTESGKTSAVVDFTTGKSKSTAVPYKDFTVTSGSTGITAVVKKAFTYNGYTFAVGSSFSETSFTGAPSASGELAIGNLKVTSSSSTPVGIALANTGYTLPTGTVIASGVASGSPAAAATNSFSFNGGAANSVAVGSSTTTGNLTYTGSYSLTETVSLKGSSFTNAPGSPLNHTFTGGNFQVDVVAAAPAPSSAILVLAGGLMFGMVRLYRRRTVFATA
jgi:hypothetical protein